MLYYQQNNLKCFTSLILRIRVGLNEIIYNILQKFIDQAIEWKWKLSSKWSDEWNEMKFSQCGSFRKDISVYYGFHFHPVGRLN